MLVIGATAAAIKALALASNTDSGAESRDDARDALAIANEFLHDTVDHHDDGSISGRSLVQRTHYHDLLILDLLVREANDLLAE